MVTEEVTVEPKAAKNKKKSPYIVISHPDEKKKKKKVVVAFKVGDEAEQQKWVSSFNEIKNKVPVS